MHEVFRATPPDPEKGHPGGVVFVVPISAPNLGGGAGGGDAHPASRLVSHGLVYQLQDDPASGPLGRIVIYATNGSTDERQWRAVGLLTPTPL